MNSGPNILGNMDRNTFVKAVAIWFVIGGILSLCGGLALAGVGGLGASGFFGSAAVQEALQESGATAADQAEFQQATAALGEVSGFAVVLGIISLVTGIISIIVAVGLFQGKAWARQGVIIVTAVSIITSLLTVFTGGGIGSQIVSLVISGVILYIFLTDDGVKQALAK